MITSQRLGGFFDLIESTQEEARKASTTDPSQGAYTTPIGGLENFKRELIKAIPANQRYFPARPTVLVAAKIIESFIGLRTAATGISEQNMTTSAHREQANRVMSQAETDKIKFERALRDPAGKYILRNANNKGNTPLFMPDLRSALLVAIDNMVGGFYALNILATPPDRLVQLIFFLAGSGNDLITATKQLMADVADVVTPTQPPTEPPPEPPPEPKSGSNTMLIAAGAIGASLIGWLLYRRMRRRRAAE